jgi:hypothetical protein
VQALQSGSQSQAALAAADDVQAAIPNIQGRIEWKWDAVTMAGVAYDMESVGFRALCDSIYEVLLSCSWAARRFCEQSKLVCNCGTRC